MKTPKTKRQPATVATAEAKCHSDQRLVMRLRNQLRARKAELDGADAVNKNLKRRIKSLSTALRDAISTYGPSPEVLVTEERQETWAAVLKENGV